MYAIISIGKKQYKVKKNNNIIIENINKPIGKEIIFKKKNIIMIFYKKKILYKKKDINLFIIKTKIISHFKNKKIKILKFKRRKNYKRNKGYKQKLTKIKINYIGKKNGS